MVYAHLAYQFECAFQTILKVAQTQLHTFKPCNDMSNEQTNILKKIKQNVAYP